MGFERVQRLLQMTGQGEAQAQAAGETGEQQPRELESGVLEATAEDLDRWRRVKGQALGSEGGRGGTSS